ncbi:hypothetical protein N7447_008092 [Penicillium robsamsonii]|uniref:uncharacterized protein n=1 Tax=Penicillium robsamsonii TaxID=1792511 RepID=UPI0025470698|nr:uncharacterized protein N7447_008092 [Penicillium robsamsonii]KAJ5815859.1 hypothetical protein N7447_008092 [Penicillium robsamsonii]
MLPLEGRSQSIFIVTTIFLGISFIAVCLRCLVRIRLVKAFGWDDTLMVCAMLMNILFALCGITGALYGIGQKLETLIERGTMETAMFWWWLGQTSYVWTCALAKLSIASALLRLTVSKAHRLILWSVIGVTCIVGLVFWFMLTLQCQPVEFFWQRVRAYTNPKSDISGTCMKLDDIIAIAYVYSITATLCDLTLGLLPIALVWKLQMNLRTKAALAGILGMGCMYVYPVDALGIGLNTDPLGYSASAAVIIRIPFLHDYKDIDFLYATANISIWSNVEAGLGIAAGSLVTLRPLFRWFRDPSSIGGSKSKTKRTGGSMPLSSMNGVHSSTSNPQYWRPDLHREDQPTVITTIHTSNESDTSRTSSQEDLNPTNGGTFFQGVNVQKTFYVSEDQTS